MVIGSCCYRLCAVFVIVISTIIFLIGLGLTGAGGILLFGSSLLKTFITPILDNLLKGVAIDGINIDAVSLVQELLDFLKPMAIGVFIAGIILLIMGFCGIFGPCCKSKCLLYTYIGIAGAILIAELGILIYVTTSSDKFTKQLSNYLLGIIRKQYVGIKSSNFVSLLMNVVQAFVGCCGVHNGTDYRNSSAWQRNFTYTERGYDVNVTLEYPLTCCKMKNFQPISINCSFAPTVTNSNYNVGCLSGVVKLIDEYLVYVSAGVGGLFGLQVCLVLFGILMILHIVSGDKGKVSAAQY